MKRVIQPGIALVLLLMILAVPLSGLSAQTPQPYSGLKLPTGFADQVAVGGLLAPRDFDFAADGRIFILERGGQRCCDIEGNLITTQDFNYASVRIYENGELLWPPAISIQTCGNAERGLLGIALDPDFATNNYLYIYYTRHSYTGTPAVTNCEENTHVNGIPHGPRNRISRLTLGANNIIDPASERVLVDTIVSDIGFHNAGDLFFGADGYLYATTGDGGVTSLPQQTNNLNGKVLRLKPLPGEGGYSTAGNPFDTATDARNCGPYPVAAGDGPCREIFGYGLRNPFRFTVKAGTSDPYVGDVGGGGWEEINKILPGANYGYPIREGNCEAGVINGCNTNQPPPTGFTNPIYAYSHTINGTTDAAVIGGDFYTGTSYPAQYWNNYFFVDFIWGFVRRVVYDGTTDTWSAATPDFATGGRGIIGMRAGPNGDLYYLTFISDYGRDSELRKIVYTDNVPPIAKISANRINGALGNFTFSAAGSYDPDNKFPPLRYNWDCGDGSGVQSGTNSTKVCNFNTPVNHTVTLTITDSGGAGKTSDPVSITVYPGNTPATGSMVLSNLTDATRTRFFAGDTWTYNVANAVDPEGAPLPDSAFSWTVVFHHREHTHPFIPQADGPSGQFVLPAVGETDPVVWYRVYLRITDARGEVTSYQQDIYPVTTTITVRTNPPGGLITMDGGSYTSPRVVSRVSGLHVGIGAPATMTVGGVTYPFAGWAHGGDQSQTIYVPTTPTTYIAQYGVGSAPLRNEISTATNTLAWNRVTWATGYEVQLARDSGFALIVAHADVAPENLNYTTPTLTDGTYYWRVRAKRADGSPGSWSVVDWFVVNL